MTPELFRETLLNHGRILVRGAVPPPLLSELQAGVAALFESYDAIPAAEVRRMIEISDAVTSGYWRCFQQDGTLHETHMVPFARGRLSLFDGVKRGPLGAVAAAAFPEHDLREDYNSVARRVSARVEGGADAPLPAHVDSFFHQHQRLGLNFWTPLQRAGDEAPGLAVIGLGPEAVKDYLDYHPVGHHLPDPPVNHYHHFRLERLEPEALADAGLVFETPVLDPGDVLVMTNFTIHKTHAAPHMSAGRTSIEARFMLH